MISTDKGKVSLAAALGESTDLAKPESEVHVPDVFGGTLLHKGINTERVDAHKKLVASTFTQPLLNAVATRMSKDSGDQWDADRADAAKAALLDLMAFQAQVDAPSDNAPLPNIDELFKYVLSPADFETYRKEDRADLLKTFKWTYSPAPTAPATC